MVKLPHQKDFSALLTAFLFSFSLLLSGCASNEVLEAESTEVEVSESVTNEKIEIDPYEGFNRKMFVFNEVLDDYVAQPISDAYLWVTPKFVQNRIGNFFSNLKDINVVLNDVMQGKVEQGAEDTGRFAVNSTIGLLGLFDVATEFGLDKHEEDFAQTLAVWGVPQGPYLVLPVLGPTTSRGVPGSVFDAAANPATYVGMPVQLLQMLDTRANAEGALKFIDEAALDPYVFTRESFLQYRKHLISDGKSQVTDDVLMDFEDDFYDEEEVGEDVNTQPAETFSTEVSVEPKAKIAKADEQGLLESNNYQLKLSSDTENFGKASNSFDGAVKSFDNATKSFEEAAEKLNQLER